MIEDFMKIVATAKKTKNSKIKTRILSGREASRLWIDDIRNQIQKTLKEKTLKRTPGLGILQIGSLAASSTYIQQKLRAAESCGISTRFEQLSSQASESEVEKTLQSLIADRKIDGIICQLPFDMKHPNLAEYTRKVLESIPADKDADGLHSLNQGRLVSGESQFHRWTSPLPATPFGIMKLLELSKISIEGLDATVIGKSRLVGTPIALMLSQAGATVSLCHKKTKNTDSKCHDAQLVIVAAGVKHLVKPHWLHAKSIVIDVGIHRDSEGKLTGDVDPKCYPRIKAYSPVPGGVGPMTVAALLQNVFNIAKSST
jgi:methylenetetrahydrofolate dehydrogenase (NADP+)/methenyltetrahydrofolate cyclohydrolase